MADLLWLGIVLLVIGGILAYAFGTFNANTTTPRSNGGLLDLGIKLILAAAVVCLLLGIIGLVIDTGEEAGGLDADVMLPALPLLFPKATARVKGLLLRS
jgi:hypothetical protein